MTARPFNKVVIADGSILERVASWCGINARELSLDHRIDPTRQKIACCNADLIPVPNDNKPQPAEGGRRGPTDQPTVYGGGAEAGKAAR